MIRKPVVGGYFYPDNPQELTETIEACYKHTLGASGKTVPSQGKLTGLILPHAGYIYSGPTVTWGMARLKKEEPMPRRFLILGPNHRVIGRVAAVSPAEAWETALGQVKLDEELRNELVASGHFKADSEAHSQEHSIEVQIPFLQHLYGKESFSVLPVSLQHTLTLSNCEKLGNTLGTVLSGARFKDVCVIISSDFSHETPKAEAYSLDSQALDMIERIDPAGFYEMVVSENRSICGFVPITVFLFAIKNRKIHATRLKYSTSMDVASHPRGVGYAAVSFEEK
ncbi:MAG: AmmeMemoRadiSam system protein B [Candidatus Riflebacteria bacterium]|nr:AmmeMemoRadiSam system protein B [Candidatus Riflebacteria bacterium]